MDPISINDPLTARVLAGHAWTRLRSPMVTDGSTDIRARDAVSGSAGDATWTEIVLVTGERYAVEGSREAVEARVLDAARGAIMELAWLTEAASGEPIGINPKYLVAVRTARAGGPEA